MLLSGINKLHLFLLLYIHVFRTAICFGSIIIVRSDRYKLIEKIDSLIHLLSKKTI